jgi:23S rRNA (cytidine1920-2'-O)/16S rRNA (cytidine1409-2'-O)-methyltransferase
VKKVRLDILLIEKKLIDSRNMAQRMIMAGDIRVNGEMVIKPSQLVSEESQIDIKQAPPFVSRGGEKLEAALNAFGMTNLNGSVCADVGASTGGFTDCLLKHGAIRVYAIDVGHGELHWKLRNDPRVISLEKTNARYMIALKEYVDLVTIDASFISLKTLMPVVKNWLKETGQIIALIKPQFEAGRSETAKGGGVIRDTEVHRKVLSDVLTYAKNLGFKVSGLIQSPLLGPKGNKEFLVHLIPGEGGEEEIFPLIEKVFLENSGENYV